MYLYIYTYIYIYTYNYIFIRMYICAHILSGTVTKINESESHHRTRNAANEVPHIIRFEAHDGHAVDLDHLFFWT